MDKNVQEAILKYLQESKSANTFKLARNLGIERSKIIRELAKLHEKGLIEHRTGMARFLSRPKPEALRPEEPTQKISKLKTERPRIKKQLSSVNIKLAEENKKLKTKLVHLRRELGQRTQSENLVSLQTEQIEELERQVQKLTRKAAAAKTKIIRKVIVRRVPVKTLIKESEEKLAPKRLDVEVRKPVRGPSWLSNLNQNISQLSVPEVFKQKVELKRISLDFGKLKKNISQLEIPDVLKNKGDENG